MNPKLQFSKEEPICKVTEKSIREVIGINPVFSAKPWWMDTQIFTDSGIPTIAFGPCGYGAHAGEEYVDINSIVKSAEIFEKIIFNFVNGCTSQGVTTKKK